MLIKAMGGGAGITPGGRPATPEYEVVYAQVYNNYAGAVPAGGHVCYDPAATAAQNLGWAVTRPATANLALYAGCSPAGIAQAGWGAVVVYGVIEEMGQDGGTTDTASGNVLVPLNASFYPGAPAAGAAGTGWIFSMEAVTTATGTGRGLVRAM